MDGASSAEMMPRLIFKMFLGSSGVVLNSMSVIEFTMKLRSCLEREEKKHVVTLTVCGFSQWCDEELCI